MNSKRTSKNVKKKAFTFIDLFAGCGGLSEGFLRTGKFKGLAHIEWEFPMVNTLRNRLIERWNHSKIEAQKRVLQFDIQKTQELLHRNWSEEAKKLYEKTNSHIIVEKGLSELLKNQTVDCIIGGPPCQAYSIAGRAQSPTGMQFDYRNYLFESFVKLVHFFKPKIFVFENVPGLLSACPGGKPVKERIFQAFSGIGYKIQTPENLKQAIYCAEDFGVPQKRNRVLIVGISKDSSISLDTFYKTLNKYKSTRTKNVLDAIGSLPCLYPLKDIKQNGRSKISHQQISGEPVDLHIPRYNGKRDQKLFKEWLSKRMNTFSQDAKKSFYTKITGHSSNHIKYRNLEWDKPAPTVVAHLQKDGYMFIHPDIKQLRTITIREAALLQSFPMDYHFLGSHPYCFKMIGNAVPVLFAQSIAEAVADTLKQMGSK